MSLAVFVITAYISPELKRSWGLWGHRFADLSVIFFVLSLIPGILKRLGVSPPLSQLQIILMTFRRQTGISVFVFALYHYLFARGFRMLASGTLRLPNTPFEIAGMAALVIALPLFITSNDPSLKILGRSWKKLHNFTHLIPWAIFLHLFWLGSRGWQSALILITAIFALISWIKISRNP
jgi:sulfoxide reductase heme-binding subunit YedZ